MSHTPGPWTASEAHPGWYVEGPPTEQYAGHIFQNEADARLIAAAPDLLAALEKAEERLRELAHQVHPQGVSYYEPAVKTARAAIAKATGK